jgi:hypothetical protein
MGKRFLHSIVQPNTDLAASGSITPFDLPVNPLSFLLLRLELTNVAPAAILTYSAIDDAITMVTGVRVLHKGEQIISGSLRDVMMVNAVYQRAFPGWSGLDNVDDSVRSLVFPICLGKRMYDPDSAFPAVQRGNLRFEMDVGADGAAFDDINFSLEAVELIESTPREHLKYVRQARDSVIGQFDARLPIGNPLLGILLFDTGLGGSSDNVLSWGTIKLLKDNVEQYYPLSDYETLAGMLKAQMGQAHAIIAGHQHLTSEGGGAELISDDMEQRVNQGDRGYAYLDFDPLRDGSYEMETSGAADLLIRGNGDEATAIRYYPIERVMVK